MLCDEFTGGMGEGAAMRIDRLDVQNFRCFDTLALDLHPEFNVLIGENGAGKTALLEALAVAAGTWVLGTGGHEPRPISEDDIRLVGRRIGEQTSFEPQAPVWVQAKGEFDGGPVTWRRSLQRPNARSGDEIAAVLLGRHPAQMEAQVQAGEPVTLPLIAYYSAARLWSPLDASHPSFTQRDLSRFTGYGDALSAHSRAGELAAWLEYEDRVAYQEKRQSFVYRAVLDTMRDMVEGTADVRFDAKRLEVVVEFAGGDVYPFALLSDGQRNMLALAGDIAMRMARLNPQFDADVLKQTPGVVLIDELDLHLHPRWQRHVAADLRRTFPLIQFVTTTHSPQILSEVEPECVTVLDKEGERVIAHKPHQSYGLDTNGVLQRLMHDPGRPLPSLKAIDEADDALEDGDLNLARAKVEELRRMFHGDDPQVARLEASINNLESLADAVD